MNVSRLRHSGVCDTDMGRTVSGPLGVKMAWPGKPGGWQPFYLMKRWLAKIFLRGCRSRGGW